MKITIEDLQPGEEEEIIIKSNSLDQDLLKLINVLKAGRNKISLHKDDKIYQVSPKEIYYFEAVDGKTFAYLEKDVFESKQRLYELDELLSNTSFFRCSKSIIVNLDKVASFAPSFQGRFEATLKNKEKVMISRQYVAELKSRLGI